jgi:thiamine-monophosphate kinase
MDEFDLIRKYFAPLATSPGAARLDDDVAEIAPGLIATTDAIVEGIHFLSSDPITTVAQKLVRVNVSDIIAKGGKPDAALLVLVWPKMRPVAQIAEFARVLGNELSSWGAHLVGGDTTSTEGPLTLTLTLLGKVGARGPVRRSGAKVGEDVWVTGTIGDGWLGLRAANGAFGALSAEARNFLVSAYRVPSPPPLAFAETIASHATASIDVSDGLVADAGHVAQASGVSITINSSKVPLSAAGHGFLANAKADLRALLTGGDDYQTLFTAPSTAREAIGSPKVAVTLIGYVGQGAGVRVLDASGLEMPMQDGGWRHFT